MRRVRLAVDRTAGRQRHATTVLRGCSPGCQIQIHSPELLNQEFTAAGGTAVARCRTPDNAAGHAVHNKTLATERKDQIRFGTEIGKRSFYANRLRNVRKREEGSRLRTCYDSAVSNSIAVVEHRANRAARISAVPADIGLHGAIGVETDSFYRNRADVPALEHRAGNSFTTADRLAHIQTSRSVLSIYHASENRRNFVGTRLGGGGVLESEHRSPR